MAYLRNKNFANNIFDYALGLELYNDLLSEEPTICAGIFISDINKPVKNLGEVHSSIFERSFPLSWFIVEHFLKDIYEFHHRRWSSGDGAIIEINPCTGSVEHDPSKGNEHWAHGIVKGQNRVVLMT